MPITVANRSDRIWKPHDKQAQFLSIPHRVFEALYGGAVGGGKSELLYMLPIVYGWHEKPGFHGVLFRETFPQLESSLILRAIPIYKMLGAHYDPQKHIATFPSGARIRFSYVSNLKEAWDHDTIEYQYVAFDELTHFSSDIYLYLTSRIRSLVDGIPPIIRSATNPGNVGHMWVRGRFVEPAPEGGRLIEDKDSETFRVFIRALLTDNPHLMAKDPGYIKRLRLLPDAEYRAKVLGDWWVFAGQVFNEWRDPFFGARFTDEPPNACHVIDDFVDGPPIYLPRILACDWGFHPGKTWVGWACVTPSKRAILYRERVWSKTNISVWGADVARISERERDSIVSCKLDPSAWQHRGEDKIIADQIIAATGLPWEKADNDRLGGKLLMHEMLRWKQKPAMFTPEEGYDEVVAFSILRNHGPEAYKDYKDLFAPPEEETNLPRFQVTKSCREFRKVIPACVYQDDDGKGHKEDVKEFTGDDPYDGGRYLIKAVDDYLSLAQNEHEKYTTLDQVVQDLDRTGDWNTYYRRMAAFESKYVRDKPRSVARKRGRFRAH